MVLNIDDNRKALAIPPLLRLAFRPLFLGGASFAALAIAWWTYFWLYQPAWNPYGGPAWWHGHEMIFGFAVTIVTGFLLTAVQNWTGVQGIRGWPLAVLASCWLIGRLSMLFSAYLPSQLIAPLDLLFLLGAALAMAYPVILAKQWRNFFFVPILLALAILNAVSHWGITHQNPVLATQALYGGIMLVSVIACIIGGRVMPMFTANGTGTAKVASIAWLDICSILSLLLVAILTFVGFNNLPNAVLTPIFAIAAFFNSWRFVRWGFWRTWQTPLLWSLHLAYAFIPLGLICLTLYSLGLLNSSSAALHCFSTGAVGGMILAMMSRVSLGHTGRTLQPPKIMALAFILVLFAAATRVIIPGWFPEQMNWGIGIAGALWVIAYAIFCFCYAPMFCTARVDGRPG